MVTAPVDVRMARIRIRNCLTEVQARSRIDAQRHEAELLLELPSSRLLGFLKMPVRSEISNDDSSQLLPQLDYLLNQTLTHI